MPQTDTSNASAVCISWAVQFAWRHCSMACWNLEFVQKQPKSVLFRGASWSVRAPAGEDRSWVDVRGATAGLFG